VERPYTVDHVDHIVLRVRDLERSEAFYTALGGRVCIRRPDNVSLEMGNVTRLTLKHEPSFDPPPVSSMDHLNLAVHADDIGTVVEYLQAQGIGTFEEDVSHTSPSVRMLDPDRNVIEIRLAGPDAAALQQGALGRSQQA
jgi:catechol 2,3-dioxygenase-like lactoylglutathione lyase family enzyme